MHKAEHAKIDGTMENNEKPEFLTGLYQFDVIGAQFLGVLFQGAFPDFFVKFLTGSGLSLLTHRRFTLGASGLTPQGIMNSVA